METCVEEFNNFNTKINSIEINSLLMKTQHDHLSLDVVLNHKKILGILSSSIIYLVITEQFSEIIDEKFI